MKEPDKSIDKVILEKTVAAIQKWHRLASLNPEDPFLFTVLKIVFRLVGIVILVAMSPLAIIGFIIGVSFVF